ncbi:single-stranded DNA-binding protein [Gleimia sp. 6138-11-ORH1]|uniref:Jag family protein n=1 Tax=Gleimia sp. 6138-11-ORH1 TaxID=2973937 RepID=UPI00216A37D3|nr:R3H domain-containing nucleic acid-binding protein [Gleimia sp. 6138-11-ORH1]MCS4485134.1 single-stranded DNA-binding protein [Gleimia sp. 6138-11-ORH1]
MAEENNAQRVEQLVEEGEFAADYLEEFLDIVNLDGDLVLDVENDRALVDIVSEDGAGDLERLVGEDGQILDALQELTRLAVQARTGERSRLMLDIASFRADRRRELAEITEEAITRVRTYGEPVMLESMNPFERKVCHDVIAAAGLASESEGVEPNRCVVVLPAAAAAANAEEE